MKTFLQPLAMFAAIFFIALAVLAMATLADEPHVRTHCYIGSPGECPQSLRNEADIIARLKATGWMRQSEQTAKFFYHSGVDITVLVLQQDGQLTTRFMGSESGGWRIVAHKPKLRMSLPPDASQDTVTPAVQVDDSAEGILPSRPQPPGPSPVEVEGRWRKPEKPKERSWYEYFFGRDRPIIDGAKNLFGGALNAIAAYIGMPLYLIKLASSLISLAVFGIIVWAVVNLVRTFKGKS